MTTTGLTSAIVCLIVGSVIVMMKTCSWDYLDKSPETMLRHAEQQTQQGQVEQAISTLEQARMRSKPGETRDKIDSLARDLGQVLGRRTDRAILSDATTALANIDAFETAYLADDSAHRPACRVIVRKTDEWLDRYRDTCSKYDLEAELVAKAVARRELYAPPAQLATPINAQDVMFDARQRVLLKRRRRYREAIELLDAFVAEAPSDPRADDVRTLRHTLTEQAESWLKEACSEVEALIESHELDDAKRRLDFLREHAPPSWCPHIEFLRARMPENPASPGTSR